MRCAIYFVPPPDNPLTIAAAEWLRRDLYSGAGVARPIDGLTDADHAFLTALPRRYGFHATLKAPFVLASGKSTRDLDRQLEAFCRRARPTAIETEIALVGNFFALVPTQSDPDLDMLAAQVVTEFDAFRAPMSADDLERRSAVRLNGRQLAHLAAWGSPYVFDQFRFHMTLTGPVDLIERDHVRMVLTRHFGDSATRRLEIDRLALVTASEEHSPFLIHSSHAFPPSRQRRIA